MKTTRKLQAGENLFTWMLLLLSLFGLVCAYLISGFKSVSSPGTFPMIATAVMVVSIVMVMLDNRKAQKPAAESLKAELRRAATEIFPPVFLVYTGIVIAYMLIMQPLHFLPSSFAFLLVSMIYLKGSPPLKAVLISACTLGGIYLIFHFLFRVVLP